MRVSSPAELSIFLDIRHRIQRQKRPLSDDIDPSFSLHAFLQKMTGNEAEVIHAWPTISLEA
jgi:hypothetical protein